MPSAADFLPSYISTFMKRLITTSPNFASGRTSRFTARRRLLIYLRSLTSAASRHTANGAYGASAGPGYPTHHAECDTAHPANLSRGRHGSTRPNAPEGYDLHQECSSRPRI